MGGRPGVDRRVRADGVLYPPDGQWIPTRQAAAEGFLLIGLLTNFSSTARNIYSQEIVKPRWRTTVNAVVIICLAVSVGVAGMVGGKFIPMIGFRGMFSIGAALALLSVLLFFAGQVRFSRRPPVAKQEPSATL